jgi:hypothetical protein
MHHPSWYRKARIAGVAIAIPGYLALFAMFPLLTAGSNVRRDWYPTVGLGAVFLIASGTILVLAPLVHDLPNTMKRLCAPSEGSRKTPR